VSLVLPGTNNTPSREGGREILLTLFSSPSQPLLCTLKAVSVVTNVIELSASQAKYVLIVGLSEAPSNSGILKKKKQ